MASTANTVAFSIFLIVCSVFPVRGVSFLLGKTFANYVAVFWVIFAGLGLWYNNLNNAALIRIPPRVFELSPVRWEKADFKAVAKKMDASPVAIEEHLPPRTGRKYIMVGGAGFLGGWIIQHLLKRGESPANIRIIDLRPPTRLDFSSGPAKEVQFVQADITKSDQVEAAFKAPWPETSSPKAEITVFHSAAIIRFFERHPSFLPLSKLNVLGTENVINASRSIGASILIFTSSGSIVQRNTRLLLIPWLEKEPKDFVQVLGDQGLDELPKTLEEFTCCYGHSKLEAETLVRKADRFQSSSGSGKEKGNETVLRTGCIRPANAIYGPGADLWELFLHRKQNISFFPNILTVNVYVENCSLGHLLYEQRLIELSVSSDASRDDKIATAPPDIGGQAFTVTDPAQPVFWSDIYAALSYFTRGECKYSIIPPTPIILASFLIERYYLLRAYLCSSKTSFFAKVGQLLPPLKGDILALQPSTTVLSLTHLSADDSRARLPPSQGGLGYKAPWTALEGLYKTIEQYDTEGTLRPDIGGSGFGHGK